MNNFYQISLIGTTQGGRDKEIERLLNSIASSTYKNLEIIFIDQTDDIIIEQLFLKHAKI
ncbi:glycosyltransferase family A protein [Escherichia coli]|nr:glycosyltransferase family A protein [Escherichia coli]